MRFTVLATDFDGTIAQDGIIYPATLVALRKLKGSGRKLVLVTGRELSELFRICPEIELFDVIVAENGAILFDPSTAQEVTLSSPPSKDLVARLRAEGVPDISVGRSIIALWKPYEGVALAAIRDLGLELQIIFNKQAVMILPSSVNKATGLALALKRLGCDPENVVGVGDAENDHAFISACGFGVAVQNAIPSLKKLVHHVTEGARGAGVAELIKQMLADDLEALVMERAAAAPEPR